MEPTRLVFVFIFLVFTLYLSTTNSCEIYKFIPSQNQELLGHVINTIVQSLVELCWRDCVWLSWCMSINIRYTNHGTVECDLNNSSKRANPRHLAARQGSEYHEMGAVDDQYRKMYQCKRKEDLGDGWFRYGKAAIKLFQQMKNWTDARIFCQSLGGDLVSIPSSHENDFVYDVFVKGLNLTYGEREKTFPDVYWKFNGYEPGVSFSGTPGDVRYQSHDGQNALYFAGNGAIAEIPAVPLNLKGFTIALWFKHLDAKVLWPTPFTCSSSEMQIQIFVNLPDPQQECVFVRTDIYSPTYWRQEHETCKCPKNEWCHFAFTWNETESLYRLVLNGVNDRKVILAGLKMKQPTRFLFGIRRPNVYAYSPFHGFIKHFMLFNKALNIQEIQTAMYWHERGVWIGLNDQANTNTFQWSDGTPVSQFSPLPDYNPQPVLSGRKCVAMRSNRKWLDKDCLEKKPFICQRPAP